MRISVYGSLGSQVEFLMETWQAIGLFCWQVIPFLRGNAWEQPPPDLASYLYKNRIVYLGMSLVPSVTELILAEFLYLQYEDEQKPIYLYINSTGTTKVSSLFSLSINTLSCLVFYSKICETRNPMLNEFGRHVGSVYFTWTLSNVWWYLLIELSHWLPAVVIHVLFHLRLFLFNSYFSYRNFSFFVVMFSNTSLPFSCFMFL